MFLIILLFSCSEDGGKVFFEMARNVLAVWVESQLGNHYNAGDECCALARGMRLLPLICFYKAADTIEDWRRMKLVLPIWATTLSFADNESNHLLWLPTQGQDVWTMDASARDPNKEIHFFKWLIAIKMCILMNQTASWTSCVCRPYLWHLLCYCPRSALPLGLIIEKRGGPSILLGL